MLLDLSRALSFFAGMVSLYWAGIGAFFVPAIGWNERLLTTLVRLSLSGGVCLLSGLFFAWPIKTKAANAPLLDVNTSRAIILLGTHGHRPPVCEFVVSGFVPMHDDGKPRLQLALFDLAA